jgi:biotin carboxylase
MVVEPSMAMGRAGARPYDSCVGRVLLLLPSGTYKAHDFMAAARAVGADVVVASDRRQALSGMLGDAALTLKPGDPEAAAEGIVRLAGRAPLDAVVAADDAGVLVAALACERLGLPGNPPAAAACTRDKAAMRAALAGGGVPQPKHAVVEPGAGVRAVAEEGGLPCVVKPLSLSASRGVIRADDAEEAADAAERVRAILAEAGLDPAAERLLVERYVPGAEVSVEALLRGGRLQPLAIFDKPDPLEGPFFEETILVTPSRLPPAARAEVERTVAAAAAALGLREGPVHAELRVAPDGQIVVLELAARTIGGLCARTLRFGLGVSLEELVLRHALGLPLEGLQRERAAAGVMMLPIPRAGVLEGVLGRDRALAVPGIAGLEVTIRRGRPVRPLPEGDRYLGFLFGRGERPEDVEGALRAAHSELEVRVSEAPVEACAAEAPVRAGGDEALAIAARSEPPEAQRPDEAPRGDRRAAATRA